MWLGNELGRWISKLFDIHRPNHLQRWRLGDEPSVVPTKFITGDKGGRWNSSLRSFKKYRILRRQSAARNFSRVIYHWTLDYRCSFHYKDFLFWSAVSLTYWFLESNVLYKHQSWGGILCEPHQPALKLLKNQKTPSYQSKRHLRWMVRGCWKVNRFYFFAEIELYFKHKWHHTCFLAILSKFMNLRCSKNW